MGEAVAAAVGNNSVAVTVFGDSTFVVSAAVAEAE